MVLPPFLESRTHWPAGKPARAIPAPGSSGIHRRAGATPPPLFYGPGHQAQAEPASCHSLPAKIMTSRMRLRMGRSSSRTAARLMASHRRRSQRLGGHALGPGTPRSPAASPRSAPPNTRRVAVGRPGQAHQPWYWQAMQHPAKPAPGRRHPDAGTLGGPARRTDGPAAPSAPGQAVNPDKAQLPGRCGQAKGRR